MTMPVPASDLWIKIQKELSGKSNQDQIAVIRRYLDDWPDEWKGPYQELKERLIKLTRRLQTVESVKSASAREDPFHVKRGGDAQVALIGVTNSGKSALVATLTNARTDVSDYPFTTQLPIPGMLVEHGAAIQIVDTPPIVSGIAAGEGCGPRLLQLIRGADAVGIVVDLSADPVAQMELVQQELATASIRLLPQPAATLLLARGKGGIKFNGIPIAKEQRVHAATLLAAHGVANAEIVVRSGLALDELAVQLDHGRLMPALIIGNKNDVPGAESALAHLRAHWPGFRLVDVNFLDGANFDRLKAGIFDSLGVVRVFLLERPAPDAPDATLIVPRASSIADVVEHAATGRTIHPALVRVWGTSVRFPGQSVGLEHLVHDGDRIHLQS
jgi:uncharacterized protein